MEHVKRFDEFNEYNDKKVNLINLYQGKKIKILNLKDEDSRYVGKTGTVEYVDDMCQLHGTWGGLAVIPEVDSFEVLDD